MINVQPTLNRQVHISRFKTRCMTFIKKIFAGLVASLVERDEK